MDDGTTAMAFKAQNQERYNAWRVKNFHLLVEAGVPFDVVNENRRFWFVVQEGEDDFGNGWTVDWIDDSQAARLLDLLNGFLDDARGWDLVFRLQQKLGLDPTLR